MKLIPNAGKILAKSHSMRAVYLGVLCLNMPDLIYLATWVDTNPVLWSIIGNLLFLYGAVGRVVAQGIDHD